MCKSRIKFVLIALFLTFQVFLKAQSNNNYVNPYTITTLAGLASTSGSVDATGGAARFTHTMGIAVDSVGNVYVTDMDNHTIRKITQSGVVTTLAGSPGVSGSADGTGSAARFNCPVGLAIDALGNLYVGDTNNCTIRKVTPAGVVTTLAGSPGVSGSADGSGSSARFAGCPSKDFPRMGIAVDNSGNVYVADTNNQTIRKISSTGVVSTLAGSIGVAGNVDGSGSSARFNNPSGLAVDSSGNVYVADLYNHTIRKISTSGSVTTLAGSSQGSKDALGRSAQFYDPLGLAIDGNGNILVAEYGNEMIRYLTNTGVATSLAGSPSTRGSTDGVGSVARLFSPYAIAADSYGNIYIGDSDNFTVRKGVPTLTTAAPVIFTQPKTQNVTVGSNVALNVSATGSSPLYYQWYLNADSIISGATSANYTISSITQNNQAPYTVVVTNAGGSVISNIAYVNVASASSVPVITTQPSSQTSSIGSSVNFSVIATGSPTPTYQWYKDGLALPNQISSTLTFSSVQPANIGYYTCVVTNSSGSVTTSQTSLNLTGYTFTQWQGLVAQWKLQGDATDTLGISNGTAQNIQWQTANVGSTSKTVAYLGGSSALGGVTVNKTSALDLPSTGYTITGWVQSPNFGVTPPPNTYFTMLDSQGVGGSQQSAYVLSYGPQGLDFQVSSLDNYPNPDSNYRNVKFVKTSDSAGDVMSANQWYFVTITYDGSSIRGYVNGTQLNAIGNSSLISAAPKSTTRTTGIGMPNGGAPYVGGYTPANNGSLSDIRLYNRALSDSDIKAMAASASSVPVITTQPISQSINTGGSVTLSVVAIGIPSPTYQWYKDGTALSNQTSSILTLNNCQANNAGNYTAVITNSVGSITSNAATLTVLVISAPPVFTVQPSSQTVILGSNVTLSATVSASPNPTYQWYKDGIAIPGATSSVFNILNAQPYNVGNYTLVAKNSLSSVTSSLASINISGVANNLWQGLVGYYPMIGSANDVTAFANNGIVNGAVLTSNQLGVSNSAYHFDGVSSTIEALSATQINSYPFTVSAWFKTSYSYVTNSAPDSITGLVSNYYSASWQGWQLGYDRATQTVNPWYLYAPVTGGIIGDYGQDSFKSSTGLSDGKWHHAVFTVSSTGGSLYLDGSLQSQSVWRGTPQATASNLSLIMGVYRGNYMSYYQGDLTSVRLYNKALSSSDIASLYSLEAPAKVAPSITVQPITQTVNVGTNVTLSVSATGTSPLTYQWYVNANSPILGATNSTYSLPNIQQNNQGPYTVTVTNSSGSVTSSIANVFVTSSILAPVITTQPLTQVVATNSTVTLSVSANGTAPLTYQWYKSGSIISGANLATYSINNFSSSDASTYYVVITNSTGSVTSTTATLSLQINTSSVPIITTQPQSQNLTQGSNLSLSVQVNSGAAFSYQWFFNGNAIAGATSATYLIGNVQSAATGSYSVEILYSGGAIFSNTAQVSISNPAVIPVISSQPQSQTVSAGSNVVFSVTTSVGTSLTYQWYLNGNVIAGATSSYYTLTNSQSGNSGIYTVSIGYPGGAIQSSSALLTVISSYVSPVITAQPQSQSVTSGTSVTFNVTATGTPAPSYQWYFNSVPITGATGTSYTVANVQPFNSGSYNVLATNPGGSYASLGGILTVASPSAPKITSQPTSLTSTQGSTVTFSVSATGVVTTGGTSANASGLATRANTASAYQWYLNGLAVSGATAATLVTTANASTAGNYQCMVVNGSGSTMSNAASLAISQTTNPGRLVNLSVLTLDGSGSQMLTLGFVTGGSGTSGDQSLLVRGNGPALTAFNIANVLPDPTLTLYSGTKAINQNTGWGTSLSNQIQVLSADAATGAFVVTNSASADSAFVVGLSPASYSVQVSSKTGVTGMALAEVYDNTPKGSYTATTPRLVNLSCLQQVVAKGILTAGFVISGDTAETVLIRVSGPALTTYNVAGVIPDPQLTVFDSNTKVLGTNAGWGGNAAITAADTSTGAFPLTDPNSTDSAILLTLNPGSYSVQASSITGKAGSALIEVYEVK